MGMSLRPDHLKRYAQIGRLLVRYGRSDLVRDAGLEQILAEDAAVGGDAVEVEAEALCADLEALGPTFVKLGQLLSTRVDLLPLPYTEALERLQDHVEPFSYAEVERIIQQELRTRISRAFLELEERPIAAASLGQVHRARLRDGRLVAVKVQRPGIREQVVEDLSVLEELAETLEHHTETGKRYALTHTAEELRRSLLRELDYRLEAANLTALADNLQRYELLVVPRPVQDYSTSRVLTMDYVRGRRITAIGPLARLEMDGGALAETLFEAYLKQVLVDGLFHADPHPGNVFLTPDGRIALIDVGMVGRVSPELQGHLTRLLLAIAEGHGEEAATLLIGMSERRPGFDRRQFEIDISEMVMQQGDLSAANLQIGRLMLVGARSAAESGLLVPPQLTLLGKTLLNLDQVGRTLDPHFEPNAAIRRSAAELLRERMLKGASPGNILSSVLEMNEFVQRLPARLNRVLDAVADREVEVRIRVTNEEVLMGGLQKVANRVASGIVVAALIVGAAMLMRVETSFRILGYPGFAMLLFTAAVVGGVLLLVSILLHDRPGSRPRE
jgi:predicted unusual protein kinase regulating ubiquinone biosynthesis (AarF/ABC1/UbiB family)